MPASYNRGELINAAAKCLKIVGSGQSLEDEDQQEIDAKVDGLIAQLREDGIVDISDEDEIKPSYFSALAELLANVCASTFGMEYSEDKKFVFERQLRRVTAATPTYETVKAEYF